LVTGATGKTGSVAVTQLLEKGFPVRALVHSNDARSEKLRSLGAEIVTGNLSDIVAMRNALKGVQRAYFVPPMSRDTFSAAMTFALAAEENKLEMVTLLSQWLADHTSPSLHTRDIWYIGKLFNWLPNVATVTINPGWFAYNYTYAGLEVIAQQGLMMLPLGYDGYNAPPSDEDIARVAVSTLINPDRHVGKTYPRPGHDS
jgi:uncharacterized protein YbjT (DUF2867 family)